MNYFVGKSFKFSLSLPHHAYSEDDLHRLREFMYRSVDRAIDIALAHDSHGSDFCDTLTWSEPCTKKYAKRVAPEAFR